MSKQKLQFTLFSKILFVASSIIFFAFFLFYIEAKTVLGPYLNQDQDMQSAFEVMIYLALSICILSVVVATFFLAQSITKPIKKLVKITEQIGLGNFDIKATDRISSTDEIGELANHFDEMAKQLKSRQYLKNIITKLHGQVLSNQFISGALEKKASQVQVAIMFLDIREFTHYSEQHSPERVVNELNRFFDHMGHIVKKHDGIIDKFMGDSFMAVWGIPEAQGSLDAINAFECSLEMSRLMELESFEFEIGIGVHYGEAILGCIGSKDQLDYTVIGDVVNTASRIQKQTKHFRQKLFISKDFKDQLSQEQKRRLQGEVQVELSGIKEVHTLYSLYPINSVKKSNQAA